MSAPLRLRIPAAALAVALAALVATGCTVPGSSRLQGPPEGLPPSLDLVTADVLGFVLVDTDVSSDRWQPLERRVGDANTLAFPLEGETGLERDGGWVGDVAGVAIRELRLDDDSDADRLWFADVRDRGVLEEALRDAGWKRDADAELSAPADDGELWTSDHEFGAAAVTDDAIVVARNRDALDTFLEAADEYAVPERQAMSKFAVEAAKAVPIAFVFRFDLLRTQVRRPFQDDPALLEFARWATDSNMLVALRDGWVGLAPPVDRTRSAVRVVGAAEWVPDLAPDITLEPANRMRLGQLPDTVDLALAIKDPGQQLRELVRAITIGAGQYVTEQDVADYERVELLPVLDDLDGQAVVGYDADLRLVHANVAASDADELAPRVTQLFDHVDLAADADVVGDGLRIDVALPPLAQATADDVQLDVGSFDPSVLEVAGDPPREPFAWFWMRGARCIGDRAGWLTFDGTERMTLSMDVALGDAPSCDSPGSPLPLG